MEEIFEVIDPVEIDDEGVNLNNPSTSAEETSQEKESNFEDKLVQLPLSRVKNIIKLDPDCGNVTSESVFAVSKATELFIQSLIKETVKFTLSSKRKIILRKDLEAAIDSISHFCFLDGSLE